MHQMFLDLAVLVHHQGEMLDTIEKHVDTAVNYVEKAGRALEAAKEHQKSARWVNSTQKKCCLLITCLIVLLVIIIPVVSVKAF